MTKTLKVRASALREGDKVYVDGNIMTITKNTPTTYTIPKKKVKSNRLFFETKVRIQGKTAKNYPHASFPSDEEFELVSRKGTAWAMQQRWDKADKPSLAAAITTLVLAGLILFTPGGDVGAIAMLVMGAIITGCIFWRKGF